MTKTISFHMIIEGGAIAQFARNMFYLGRIRDDSKQYKPSQRISEAKGILDNLNPKLSDDQIGKIFTGDATLAGASVCDKKSCTQCKGLEPIHFVDKPSTFARMEIAELKLEKIERNLSKEDAEWIKDDINPTLEDEIRIEKHEERGKKKEVQEKEIEKQLKSNLKGKIKLGNKYEVKLVSLDEYAKSIAWSERSGLYAMTRGDPMISYNALQGRITKHKRLYKEAGIKYHGEEPSISKNKDARELYDLIEEWITKNHPELEKGKRVKRAGDEASVLGKFVRPRGDFN